MVISASEADSKFLKLTPNDNGKFTAKQRKYNNKEKNSVVVWHSFIDFQYLFSLFGRMPAFKDGASSKTSPSSVQMGAPNPKSCFICSELALIEKI